MWRPNDWEEIKPKKQSKGITGGVAVISGSNFDCGVEAGADAMLRAILKSGLVVINLGEPPQGKGTVIFIPDEQ